MKRMWVRLSLSLSLFIALILILPMGSLFFYVERQEVSSTTADADGGFLGIDNDANNTLLQAIPETVLATFLLSGIAGIAVSVWIGRRLSKPITDLAHAAYRIGAGDLSSRVSLHGAQEITDLADSFNRMASDLERGEQLRRNLIADVSHELNTPLTVLEGHLRAALDHVYALDEAEIANLYGQTRHLILLVKDMRELAQVEADQLLLDKQKTDLRALIAETIQLFEPLADEKVISLTAVTADNLPHVDVDRKRIRQILDNLIGNALRHTAYEGNVTVFAYESERGGIELIVQDDGEGIPREKLPHLFERFYRTDPSRSRESGSSGLGLAIVQALVVAHGGQIQVDSQGLNHGTTFTIRLPN